MDKTERFAQIIKNSSNIVFFGGAGVSTESGIKDYRSEDGIYNTVKQYGVSPETILSHTFLYNHTDVFYDFYHNYFLKLSPMPNKAHYALAKLEKIGKLKAVITQNIDGLHQAAGSKRVYELHGTVSRHYCSKCGADFDTEEVRELKGKVPYCKSCGGFVRPDVVMYEEGLKEEVTAGAILAIRSADLLIIGGTSLCVYPAAGFINYFNGDNIVLINRDETAFDERANIIFRDKIGEIMDKAVSKI